MLKVGRFCLVCLLIFFCGNISAQSVKRDTIQNIGSIKVAWEQQRDTFMESYASEGTIITLYKRSRTYYCSIGGISIVRMALSSGHYHIEDDELVLIDSFSAIKMRFRKKNDVLTPVVTFPYIKSDFLRSFSQVMSPPIEPDFSRCTGDDVNEAKKSKIVKFDGHIFTIFNPEVFNPNSPNYAPPDIEAVKNRLWIKFSKGYFTLYCSEYVILRGKYHIEKGELVVFDEHFRQKITFRIAQNGKALIGEKFLSIYPVCVFYEYEQ